MVVLAKEMIEWLRQLTGGTESDLIHLEPITILHFPSKLKEDPRGQGTNLTGFF